MKQLLKNATVYTQGRFIKTNIEITDGIITKISNEIEENNFNIIYDLKNLYLLPGLIDVHTHLREPGFIYKETIKTGSMAGAKGEKGEELADLTVYNLEEQYNIDSNTFVSMGKTTPFDGNHVYGKCKMTMCNGNIVYNELKI